LPKIELHRPSLGKPLLCEEDESILAVAADAALGRHVAVPLLDLNDPPAIALFIRQYCAVFSSSQ
jgi:molybdopterin-guanine dinucleotide biosynthesis protein